MEEDNLLKEFYKKNYKSIEKIFKSENSKSIGKIFKSENSKSKDSNINYWVGVKYFPFRTKYLFTEFDVVSVPLLSTCKYNEIKSYKDFKLFYRKGKLKQFENIIKDVFIITLDDGSSKNIKNKYYKEFFRYRILTDRAGKAIWYIRGDSIFCFDSFMGTIAEFLTRVEIESSIIKKFKLGAKNYTDVELYYINFYK
jgi:hypothetical protein